MSASSRTPSLPRGALLRSTLALFTLAALAACSGKEGRIESGLKKGAEFVRLSDWDKASVEARNVLQIDPKNAQAYLISAQVSEGQREVQRAYASYLKAVELKPDLTDAKLGLARIYLFANEVDKAEPLIKDVLAADAGSVGGRTLAAALLAKRGQAGEAMAQTRALIASQKQVPADASILLAGMHANQGQSAEALAAIDRALKDEPKHAGLLQIAAQITSEAPKGDPLGAKAETYYRQATQQTPKNADLWTAWAATHIKRGETDKAEAVLRESLSQQPTDSKRSMALFGFLAQYRGVDAAEKEIKAAIGASTRNMALRFALVDLYRSINRQADAQVVLGEIADLSDDPPSTLSAKSQLAAYHLAGGRIDAAGTLVAEVLKASPRENAALLLRGRIALLEGRAAEAVIDLRAVAKDQPGSAEAMGLLAEAHRKAGENQLAREVLAEATKARPEDPALRLLLVNDMVEAREFRGAATELEAAIKAAPQALRLHEAKAQLALTQKDLSGAERALQAMKTRFPQDPTAYLRLGQLYTQQNRIDAALKEYEAAMTAMPRQALPYIASVGLLSGSKRFDAANALIDRRQQADPKNVMHYQLRGDVAIAKRDLPAAEAAYRGAIGVAPAIPVGYINTARVLGLRNDAAGAIAVLEQGEKAAPSETSITEARAEWLTRTKRYDEAIQVYETLLKAMPGSDTAANNLAFLLTEHKGDKASLERAITLTQRFAQSRNPGYLDSLGWAHHKAGQYDKAVPLLEKAVALAPSSPIYNLHLGKALVKSGNAPRGKEYLRKAIESKADLPYLEEAKAMVAQG